MAKDYTLLIQKRYTESEIPKVTLYTNYKGYKSYSDVDEIHKIIKRQKYISCDFYDVNVEFIEQMNTYISNIGAKNIAIYNLSENDNRDAIVTLLENFKYVIHLNLVNNCGDIKSHIRFLEKFSYIIEKFAISLIYSTCIELAHDLIISLCNQKKLKFSIDRIVKRNRHNRESFHIFLKS